MISSREEKQLIKVLRCDNTNLYLQFLLQKQISYVPHHH
jgi:hypothetical protein